MSASLVDSFEPPCDFTRQDELFPGTWIDDGSADGLYCHPRPYRDPFVIRLWLKLDRDADRREAAQRVMTFDEKMTETLPNAMMTETQQARRKHRPPGRIWSDDIPEGAMYYAEICDWPRPEFWSLLMKWRTFTLEMRAALDPDFRYELEKGDWD